MSNKTKLKKLQLPKCSRRKSNSQISNFFSTSTTPPINEETSSSMPEPECSKLDENHIYKSNDIIFIDSDDSGEKSNYLEPKLKQRKTAVSKFFNDTLNNDQDFENVSSVKKIVKTTKTKKMPSVKPKSKIRKKSSKIKSVFVKNEEIFSDIIAQHSIVDNFNPDDIQMALALSMSESNEFNLDEDSTKSLECIPENSKNICDKLKAFGFKTNRKKNDYDLSNFLSCKKKRKWANKFTPLTLRNSEKQHQKLINNIEKFIHNKPRNNFLDLKSIDYKENFLISSSYLQNLETSISLLKLDREETSVEQFYVTELFAPSSAKVGCLMKDLNTIPGRDLSPNKLKKIKPNEPNNQHKSILFTDGKAIEPILVKELESVLINESESIPKEEHLSKPNSFSTSIEKNKNPVNFPNEDLESSESPLCSPCNKKPKLFNIDEENSEHVSENDLSSKDLFAEYNLDISEESNECSPYETCTDSSNVLNLESFKSTAATYEKFSSDEVKTVHEPKITEDCPKYIVNSFKKSFSTSFIDDDLIDLTQENEDSNFKSKSFINLNENHSYQSQLSNSIDRSDSDCCIILSDDEVNYSVKIANQTKNIQNNSELSLKSKDNDADSDQANEKNNFSFIDLIENYEICNKEKSLNLNIEENENFSFIEILEENEDGEITPTLTPQKSQSNYSQTKITPNNSFDYDGFISPINISPTKLYKKQLNFSFARNSRSTDKLKFSSASKNLNKIENCRKTLSESFISPKKSSDDDIQIFKKYSSAKFRQFVNENQEDDEQFSDTDEIDKLIFGSPYKNSIFNKPKDFKTLLTGNLKNDPQPSTSNCSEKFSSCNFDENQEEIQINGKIYLIKTEKLNKKPDFVRMDSPTRLRELYKYGLKPLKKKQAVIMLEYIYNQTHPFIIKSSEENKVNLIDDNNKEISSKHDNKISTNLFNHKLKDCFGKDFLKNDNLMLAENDNEKYIFQTNSSKKIFTALLPFHVAWYNLIRSNYNLRESVLHYEPIDLQEIYIFLKKLGYRYDPKDIKFFFDSRSIIFRYDLNPNENNNRHSRKKENIKKKK